MLAVRKLPEKETGTQPEELGPVSWLS
jgi:hypothetical protein